MEQTMATSTTDYSGEINQYLTFSLGDEEYGIEILKVQEIKGYSAITYIPNTPPHIKGVMNLRGTVIPVVDLRAKFSMPATEYNKFTVIIVVTVGAKILGLVVDAVSDVLNIACADVRPAPDFGARVDTKFISGVASLNDRLAVLLDIQKLLSEDELSALSGLNPETTGRKGDL
ncbi:MAG TPA: chemotaxis protein CheW [Bryobacteraceae bacterium]|nr:chemotaxis protein CheW [Bryobacteraceae bacterium]